MTWSEVLDKVVNDKCVAKLPHWNGKFIKFINWESDDVLYINETVSFMALVDVKNGKVGPFTPHACDVLNDEWELV
jgi:hypothetical protein